MHPLNYVLTSVLLLIADGFTVCGPSAPLSAPLGSSVVLPCYVDEALPVEDLEVEWRRADSETLVHLYQDGESRPEVQQQDYHDRAHFFSEEIQHGNFSLRLDNLRAQDEGQYRCTVHSQQNTGKTVARIKDVERLLASGSDELISAYVGDVVTLNCSVDSHIKPEHIEVSWIRTDRDILVLLYENNETVPEAAHEQYRDRVEFFNAEIPKGNFSLKLKSVRTEDKGVYMCQVFAGDLSANATVVLGGLGFSAVHIIMMILCVSASGSSLLLCFMIYCRSPTKGFFIQLNYQVSFFMGTSVVLPCHVDRHIFKKMRKVEWRRKNTKSLILLYQDGESQANKPHEDYIDRAHFFTEEIQHGNFSLRLDNLRAEDAGKYTCTVYSHQLTVIWTAEIRLVPRFMMKGSSCFKTVPLGGSLVLPCKVDKHFLHQRLKVEWRRSDSETLVYLYQDGESRLKKQNQDYHDRAHFFTEQIQHGNFSLQLDYLTAEDEGRYTCRVYNGQTCVHSAEAEVVIPYVLVEYTHQTLALPGSSVVLPCYVSKALPVEDLEVEWRRADTETLVHLYQDGESRAEVQQQDYHDRAHFFTEEIQHGNFSLRLDNLTAQDEGEYRCEVYRHSNLMFFVLNQLVLRLLETTFRLHMLLVFCPNILMFFALVFWSVSEGSLFESVSCCALYFLRPLMLLWAAPYIFEFTGNIKTRILYDSFGTEYLVFSAVFDSVLFKSIWDKSLNYTGFERAVIILLFVMIPLINLIDVIYLLTKFIGKLSNRILTIINFLSGICIDVMPSLQFILLFFASGSGGKGFFIVAVLPVFLTVTKYNWDLRCGKGMGCSPSFRRSVWLILMLLTNAVMVYFYIIALENEKDRVGWVCMIALLQLFWAMTSFSISFNQTSDFNRAVAVYVFGSVVVVLLNSVNLMTELILKTVNGKGAVGDLRVVVFSSEFIFSLMMMILQIFDPWFKTCLQSCQKVVKPHQTPDAGESWNQEHQGSAGHDEHPASESNQNTAEALEMETLLKTEDQDTGMKTCLQSCQNAAPGSDETPASGLNENNQDTADEPKGKCVVLYDYTPAKDDELELVKGETIEILMKDSSGWWKGKKNNQTGLFPSNYVKEIDVPSEVTKSNHILDSQNVAESEETPARSNQKQKTTEPAESFEMSPLLKPEDQEAGMTGDNPLYSVETET